MSRPSIFMRAAAPSPHALGKREDEKRRPDAGAGGELRHAEWFVEEEYAEKQRDRRAKVLEEAEDVQRQEVRAVGEEDHRRGGGSAGADEEQHLVRRRQTEAARRLCREMDGVGQEYGQHEQGFERDA